MSIYFEELNKQQQDREKERECLSEKRIEWIQTNLKI
jgi:hypothetical protein